MKTMLEARDVAVRYEKEGVFKTVLQGFFLQVRAGEVLTILGASGCGKTTALNVLGGFIPPLSGEVLMKGSPLLRPSFSAVMVFQDSHQLFPWLRLSENVALPVKKRHPGKPSGFYAETAAKNLGQVGLAGYGKYYPHELSTGMRQRGAIARALASEPDILLMDEPFASVDAITRESLQELVLDLLTKKELTVVFVTHDIEEALFLSDRILVMKKRPGVQTRPFQNRWKGLRKTGRAYFEEKERIKMEITG